MEFAVAALVAILAALIIIIFELKKISSGLGRLQEKALWRPESRDSSPTINVNVGSLPARDISGDAVPPSIPVDEPPAENNPIPEVDLPVESKPAWTSLPTRTAASGLGIVKCPHCGSENSSFRNECFNCAKSLG